MIRFLTLSEIMLIYEDQIRNYGGAYGVRDITLLNSALYMPQSSFEGAYLHKTIPEMAAAYAYHICQNHALVDGNKRVALASSLVFLDLNGFDFNCAEDEIYNIIMALAKSQINKTELTKYYIKYATKRTK